MEVNAISARQAPFQIFPKDIWKAIALYLHPHALCQLEVTCKDFQRLIRDEVCKEIVLQISSATEEVKNWKHEYLKFMAPLEADGIPNNLGIEESGLETLQTSPNYEAYLKDGKVFYRNSSDTLFDEIQPLRHSDSITAFQLFGDDYLLIGTKLGYGRLVVLSVRDKQEFGSNVSSEVIFIAKQDQRVFSVHLTGHILVYSIGSDNEIDNNPLVFKLRAGPSHLPTALTTIDNQRIAIGWDSGEVYVWDGVSKEAIEKRAICKEAIKSLAFSDQGLLCLGVNQKALVVWNLENNTTKKTFFGEMSIVTFKVLEDKVIIAREDGTIEWIQNGQKNFTRKTKPDHSFQPIKIVTFAMTGSNRKKIAIIGGIKYSLSQQFLNSFSSHMNYYLPQLGSHKTSIKYRLIKLLRL